jgi:hypothetical protein
MVQTHDPYETIIDQDQASWESHHLYTSQATHSFDNNIPSWENTARRSIEKRSGRDDPRISRPRLMNSYEGHSQIYSR